MKNIGILSSFLLFLCILLSVPHVFGENGPDTVISNAGFEQPSILSGAIEMATPDDWYGFSSNEKVISGVTDRRKRNGLQSLMIKSQKEPDAYQGFAQKLAVTPGQRYEFSAYVVNDARDLLAGQAYGQVSIEWLDVNQVEITRNFGPVWNFELSPTRWEKFLVGAEAPAGAVTGVAVITFYSRDANGYGSCYIDDVNFKRE